MIFRSLLVLFGVLDLVLIDQITKWLAHRYFITPYEVISWLVLRYEENPGIAWSIPIPLPVIIGLNILLIIALLIIAFRYLNFQHNLTSLVVILILGGALGNIYDRLVQGYVIDFIAISSWPVFNLADVFICLGVFLGVVFYGIMKRQSAHSPQHDNSRRDEEPVTASDTNP